jgi:hypothetical protein
LGSIKPYLKENYEEDKDKRAGGEVDGSFISNDLDTSDNKLNSSVLSA